MELSDHFIRVRKYPDSMAKWKGVCICGKSWQFHFFGATLGFGLEHIRRGV